MNEIDYPAMIRWQWRQALFHPSQWRMRMNRIRKLHYVHELAKKRARG